MSKLPVVSGKDVIKALSKIGYEIDQHNAALLKLALV